MKTKLKKWGIRISIILNIVFLIGVAESLLFPPKMGRLEKDFKIGYFTSDSILFKLPKGLTVREASEKGLGAIGQFENNRFEIIITSDDANLVNYNLPKDSLYQFRNMYSTGFR